MGDVEDILEDLAWAREEYVEGDGPARDVNMGLGRAAAIMTAASLLMIDRHDTRIVVRPDPGNEHVPPSVAAWASTTDRLREPDEEIGYLDVHRQKFLVTGGVVPSTIDTLTTDCRRLCVILLEEFSITSGLE